MAFLSKIGKVSPDFAQTLPAWSGNLGKRLVKSPKLFLVDTGIACHLLGISNENGLRGHPMAGNIMENFVFAEIRKQLSWSVQRAKPYHFRSHTGQEVDLVLEDPTGKEIPGTPYLIIGISLNTCTTTPQIAP